MRVLVVEDFEVLARSIGTGLRREGMAVDVVLDGTDALDHLAPPATTSSCWTGTCPESTATRSAGGSWPSARDEPGADADRRRAPSKTGSTASGWAPTTTCPSPSTSPSSSPASAPSAAARRARAPRPSTHGDITLDPTRRVAFRAGRRLELSPKEFAVLECLLASPGRVVSAEELLERVWDEAADPFTTAVKTTMRRLRAKLGDPPVIETVREGGYRIGGP